MRDGGKPACSSEGDRRGLRERQARLAATRTVVVLVISTLVAGCGAADESEQAGKLTDAELTSLVDALVSPNRAPIVDGPSRVELPNDWNAEGQRKVEDAWRRLAKAGPPAIPFLIEQIDDERYCAILMHGLDSSHYNLNVGGACRSILREIVVPYSRFREIEPRNRRPSYLPNDKVELKSRQ